MAEKDMDIVEFKDLELIVINNYLLDHNYKFTAQRCGMTYRQCYDIVNKAHVRKEITRRQSEVAEKCDLNLEMVLNELKRVAFYDIKDHIKSIRTNTPENIEDKDKQKEIYESFIELQDFDHIDGRSIAEITEKTGKHGIPELKIKTHSKMDALKTLAEYFKSGDGSTTNNVQININELKGRSAQHLSNEYLNAINEE